MTRKPGASSARSAWIPDRQDIIWIDCNPQVGREMRDVHHFLVLSTTAAYNADNPFAVAAGAAKGRKAGQTSYVLCHQPKSFDWRLRGARPHPLGRLSDSVLAQVCECLNQIVRLA